MSRRTPRIAAWATLACLFYLLAFQVTRLFATPMAYDDAYLAAAAKSLAFGHGYATHYPGPQPFDVRLGVGAALQLPAAGLIALLGNRYWVPGLANILVIQVLLAAIALHLRRRLAPDARDGVALAGLVALLVITTDRDEWILSHWYAFLGDIPASLAVILGCLLVADGIDRRRTPGFAAGLALGLALEIKLIALLGIMPALLATFWFGWRARDWISGQKLLRFAGAVLLPIGLAQLWRLWALGGLQGYRVHQRAWGSYFSSEGGSGLSLLATVMSFRPLAARAATNGRLAVDYFRWRYRSGRGPGAVVAHGRTTPPFR